MKNSEIIDRIDILSIYLSSLEGSIKDITNELRKLSNELSKIKEVIDNEREKPHY